MCSYPDQGGKTLLAPRAEDAVRPQNCLRASLKLFSQSTSPHQITKFMAALGTVVLKLDFPK